MGFQGIVITQRASHICRVLYGRNTKRPLGASCKPSIFMAGSTGLEPAASAVTGQRSNQLNYDPATLR